MNKRQIDRLERMLSRKRLSRKKAMKELVKVILKPVEQEQLKAAS